MKSLNTITTIGNLTKDVELKTTKNGTTVATMNIASSNSKNSTNFYTVYVYGAFADTCVKYLKKGSRVCVQGELNISTIKSQDGKVFTYVNIDSKEIYFLSTSEPSEQNNILNAKEGAPIAQEEDLPF